MPSDIARAELGRLARDFSIETTPGAARKIGDYREFLAPGTTVYVTLLPETEISETLATCKRLAREGFIPVPHFAARQIPDYATLENALIQLRAETDSTQVLTVAGGSRKPTGIYSSSMQMLDTGLFDKHGIRTIGVAGHPEGSPDIPDKDAMAAIEWKNAFAQRSDADFYLITQFCFLAQPVIDWIARIESLGNTLPVHLGVPGIASLGALLKHAAACGIGPSMQVIKKQARSTAKLLTNSTPERLLMDIVRRRTENPGFAVRKLHVYPLGGLRKSAYWFRSIESGDCIVDEAKGTIAVGDVV